MSVKKIMTHHQKSYIKDLAGSNLPVEIKAHQKTGGLQT